MLKAVLDLMEAEEHEANTRECCKNFHRLRFCMLCKGNHLNLRPTLITYRNFSICTHRYLLFMPNTIANLCYGFMTGLEFNPLLFNGQLALTKGEFCNFN